MKVLFIGGTGVISSACSQLAVEQGFDLYLLNRGQTTRPAAKGAHLLRADIRDLAAAKQALKNQTFDAVVDWIAFQPAEVAADVELFRDVTAQYIFISSATVYGKPAVNLPIVESAPLGNPYWDYAAAKVACEEVLVRAYQEKRFPMTIVRPSHTYDETKLLPHGGYTMVARMRQGKKVIVPGDGTSLWTMTHHRDFAKGFVGLLGNPKAIGEAFHITSDEALTWNQIYEITADAAGCQAQLAHLPSELIAAYDPEWGAALFGDKAYSTVFDNSKIKRAVPGFCATIPFYRGARESMAWFDADQARQEVDVALDRRIDRMLAGYAAAWPR